MRSALLREDGSNPSVGIGGPTSLRLLPGMCISLSSHLSLSVPHTHTHTHTPHTHPVLPSIALPYLRLLCHSPCLRCIYLSFLIRLFMSVLIVRLPFTFVWENERRKQGRLPWSYASRKDSMTYHFDISSSMSYEKDAIKNIFIKCKDEKQCICKLVSNEKLVSNDS